MGVDLSVTANPFGTGGMGDFMGGWTVHLPSPLGQENEPCSLPYPDLAMFTDLNHSGHVQKNSRLRQISRKSWKKGTFLQV